MVSVKIETLFNFNFYSLELPLIEVFQVQESNLLGSSVTAVGVEVPNAPDDHDSGADEGGK